ncbi:MAG: hypothetical protein J6J51_07765 [Clostridia bacterium]|nr:hypothetical protein [Oscillospiraceae bacterium]MBP3588916.1 hypothetical protein [Clostridia bacterium]
MDPAKVKELKKYLAPGPGWLIIGTFLLVISALTLPGMGFPALIYLVFGAVLLWIGISSTNDVKKLLKSFEEKGELGRVLSDFESAQSYIKGKLRVGSYYLFGKKKGQVVRFEDIRQIWQTVHKRNGIESHRTLQYIDRQGKTQTLCDLQSREKSNDELIQIMTLIKLHNPGVHLGYK